MRSVPSSCVREKTLTLLTPLWPLPQPTTVSGRESPFTSPKRTRSTCVAAEANEPMLVHTPSCLWMNMMLTPVEEVSSFS